MNDENKLIFFLVIIENLLRRIKKIQREYLKGIKNLTQKRKTLSRFLTNFVCCSGFNKYYSRTAKTTLF